MTAAKREPSPRRCCRAAIESAPGKHAERKRYHLNLTMNDGPVGSTAHPAIRDRLLRLVGHILGKPEAADSLSAEARLSELGMSSIKMVNLMLAVETEFDLTIPQGDITPDNFRSVASVEALVTRLLALKS